MNNNVEILNLLKNRVHIGVFPVWWRENGIPIKGLLVPLLYNVPLSQNVITLLLKEKIFNSYEEGNEEIFAKIRKLLSSFDKNLLIQVLGQKDLYNVEEKVNLIKEYGIEYFSEYSYQNLEGKKFPFVIEDFNPDEPQEKILEHFLPLVQEWANDIELNIMGVRKGGKVHLLNALVSTYTIKTEEDLDNLIEERLKVYNELKSQYPEEAKRIEEVLYSENS